MPSTAGNLLIAADTSLIGDVRQCRRLDVFGNIEGDIVADEVFVHPGATLTGRMRADNADIRGTVEGEIKIRNLIAIGATGSVSGDVQYGRMSLESGGELAARVRNVPPHLVGDFSMSVKRGQRTLVTTDDIFAVDPDNTADELVYAVSQVRGGHIANTDATATALQHFTQAELLQKRIVFVHDGGAGAIARFDVVVQDADGASSGSPRTVTITVADAAAA